MIRVISLDMDGTLVKSRFVDKVWMEGMPMLYAEKTGLDFPDAKEYVVGEYMKIGSDHLEWYDLLTGSRGSGLKSARTSSCRCMRTRSRPTLRCRRCWTFSRDYELVVTSNAAREFIDIELKPPTLFTTSNTPMTPPLTCRGTASSAVRSEGH